MATLVELMDLNELGQCAKDCTRQSRWKPTTQRFLSNLLPNLSELQDEVLEHRYEVRPTNDFYLNERGHIRKIEAPAVRDRVVQKTLTKNVLTPSIVPYLIYDNYASLKQRGTHFARRRFEMMLHQYIRRNGTDGYILLIDIRKYFENINHEVLKEQIAPRISDQPLEVVELIHYIIDKSSHSEKGLNLGSEAPQILAVYYLNIIDHYAKVVRSIKYYGRYMDDIFIIGESKEELSQLLTDIEHKLAEVLLEINERKTQIVRLRHGFTWLQTKYNILPTGRIIKRLTRGKVARERRRLKAFRKMLDEGRMTEAEVQNAYQSWRGSVVKEYNCCFHSLQRMDALYKELFPFEIEYKRRGRAELIREAFEDSEKEDIQYIV